MFGRIRDRAASLARRAAGAGADAVGRVGDRVADALERRGPQPLPAPPPEPGRSHLMEKPHHLGARGWYEVAWKIWEEVYRDRLFLVAAGVAFFTLLAIFPALSALVAIWGLFADPGRVTDAISDLAFMLPPGGVELLREQARLVATGGQRDLTFYIGFGIAISLWSANAGMKSMFEAMNVIYGEEEKRGFFELNLRSALFTFGALAIFLATIGFLVVLPIILAWVNWKGGVLSALALLRWPALFVITVVFLTLLNRYGPSRPPWRARWSVWGSTLGAFMWLAVSLLFSYYVGHVSNLTATYGSLAAIAGLMTWLWLSALVILIGIELNAELEHRTERWEEDRKRRLEAALTPARGVVGFWRRLRRRP